jgi:hypothetical protein
MAFRHHLGRQIDDRIAKDMKSVSGELVLTETLVELTVPHNPADSRCGAASTVITGMSLAGICSQKRGLDHWAMARTTKTALKFSVSYGLVQDMTANREAIRLYILHG